MRSGKGLDKLIRNTHSGIPDPASATDLKSGALYSEEHGSEKNSQKNFRVRTPLGY